MEKYFILQPSNFKLDGGAMFGIIPHPLWSKVAPPDEANRIDLALRLVLIQTNNRLILIDTGIGDYHDPKFVKNFAISNSDSPLEKALSYLGFSPADITDLVISHLHFDHVGGLVKKSGDKLIPVLEQARIHLHKDHYQYALSPTERDAGSFQHAIFRPVVEKFDSEKKVNWLEGKEGLILEEGDYQLCFKQTNGHTPFLIHPYDQKFIYLTDICPTSNHMKGPWVMGYDISPGVSVADKKEILNFASEKELLVIFEHDPKFIGGYVDLQNRTQSLKNALPQQEKLAHELTF